MSKTKQKHKAKDGPGGFLAKNGEHDGNLVILFPGKYQKKFRRVVITKRDGSKERLKYTGKANADQFGPRQHWRGKEPIQKYGGAKVAAHQKTVVHIWRLRGARSGRVD